MERLLTAEEFSRMSTEYDKVKYQCRCGHKVIIPARVDKQLCSWCGRYVFKNNQEEFKYRIKEKIK